MRKKLISALIDAVASGRPQMAGYTYTLRRETGSIAENADYLSQRKLVHVLIVAGQSLIMAVVSAVCCQWASFSWGVDILRIINQGKLEARHI